MEPLRLRNQIARGITMVVFLISCDKPFSFTPYDAAVPGNYHNTTEKNLRLITASDTVARESFKVALLSDTHYHYDDLADAVQDINARKEHAFAIVSGDIAESGLLDDYIFFHNTMQKLDIPYVTVIGNHDYLSNGGKIYQQMFGDFNYSFVYNNVRFILFDNVFWESKKQPDFLWLENELAESLNVTTRNTDHPPEGYHHIIPFSHIPPFDQQFSKDSAYFHQLLATHNVKLSVHGHKHDFFLGELFGDGVLYLTVPSPQKRSYAELVITPQSITVQKTDY